MLQENDYVEDNDIPNTCKAHHHQAHSVSVVGKINESNYKDTGHNDEVEEDTQHFSPFTIPLASPSKLGRSSSGSLKIRVLEILKAELHLDVSLEVVEQAYSSVNDITSLY